MVVFMSYLNKNLVEAHRMYCKIIINVLQFRSTLNSYCKNVAKSQTFLTVSPNHSKFKGPSR